MVYSNKCMKFVIMLIFTALYNVLQSPTKKNSIFIYSWPGRAHDAQVWHHSPLCKKLADYCHIENQWIDETFHILGDSAYPMCNYLMSPFCTRARTLSECEKKFKTHLASKRSVIECAFGLLGLRFPQITHLKCRSNKKCIKLVVATCVLHNWCLMEDDDDDSMFELLDQELEVDVNDHKAAAAVESVRANSGGVTNRDFFM